MSDSDAPLDEHEDETPSEDAAVAPSDSETLDLTKYRTRELTEKIVELISVKDAVVRLLRAIILLEVLVVVGVNVLFYASTLSYGWWFVACAYALIGGFVFGVVLGLLRIASAALGHVEGIMKINIDIGRHAVTDAANLKSGKTRPPSGAQLIEMAHDQVLWPVIEEVIAESLGFIGTPLLWIYRWTIARAVRYVVKLVDKMSMTKESESKLQEQFTSKLASMAEYAETTDAYLVAALGVVETAGTTIRSYVMRPLYIIFFFCMFLTFVPLLVVRYLASGEATG